MNYKYELFHFPRACLRNNPAMPRRGRAHAALGGSLIATLFSILRVCFCCLWIIYPVDYEFFKRQDVNRWTKIDTNPCFRINCNGKKGKGYDCRFVHYLSPTFFSTRPLAVLRSRIPTRVLSYFHFCFCFFFPPMLPYTRKSGVMRNRWIRTCLSRGERNDTLVNSRVRARVGVSS